MSCLAISNQVRTVAADGFLVVLDRASGTYFSLNGVGADVWSCLEQRRPADEIPRILAAKYEADPGQVEHDVETLLQQLIRQKLLTPTESIADSADSHDATETVDSSFGHWIDAWNAVPPEARRGPRPAAWFGTLRALGHVVSVGLAMRTGGMRALYDSLEQVPLRAPTADPARAWAWIDQSLTATSLYFKKAWCLQRSVAGTLFLRSHGVPAEVVIGVVPVPFAAHAWIEIGSTLVNDSPGYVSQFTEIDRL